MKNRQYIDFKQANQLALGSLKDILEQWLPNGRHIGNHYVPLNPTRNDRSPGSFRICTRTGRWIDYATGDKGGDVISLAAYLFGLSQYDAAANILRITGGPSE